MQLSRSFVLIYYSRAAPDRWRHSVYS